ncbi:hypothetical protein EFK50_16920 [Nocardioides marmoriginsengisoli]|uniref:DUF2993 domain-containing protein n=1 Tax=Nocardioides marmoriginsengisoli TaxID=661483 RepID=A0A3N0CCA2_9ACTN|nr:hypothetical protein [Nocardioides marmoriginsengisoli]RNL61064.1 hypothetical protein EFK50_16920 [Nocardioides marmoriginsengisoli]
MKAVSRRRALGVSVCTAIPAVLLGLGATPAHAEASFNARVDAQVFHVTITNDKGSIPTLPQIDAGLGTAQATFTSFGGGVARAASPDAGSAASVPALLGALVPTLIPKPLPFPFPSISIPGDITVQAGEKPAKVATGPYALTAAVTENTSESRATLGGALDEDNGVLNTVSTAKITVDDDRVTATATSIVDAVRINGLVSLGRVQSKVEVVRDPDGKIHRTSDTKIGLLEIAGLTLEYKNDQFVTPIGNLPISLKQVGKLLSTATRGLVELQVVDAQETDKGMISGSLRLIQTVPPPPKCIAIPLPTPIVSGVTYCGTTTVVYDLGKASASIDYAVLPDEGDGDGGGGTVTPPGTGPVLPDTPLLPSGDLPVTSPPLIPGALEPALPVLTPPLDDPLLLGVRARFVDMSNLYLAVAGFAVLLLLSSTCIRLLGVRNKWTS